MAHNGCKITIEFILCWPITDEPGPALKCGFYPVKPRWRKLIFVSRRQLHTAASVGKRDRVQLMEDVYVHSPK